MVFQLSFEELDGYIQQICTGSKLVYVDDTSGKERALLFKYPKSEHQLVAGLVYKQALQEAERMELPSTTEMEALIEQRGIFTEEDEAKIEKLRSRIAGQQAVLAKTTRVPARRDRLKKIISDLQLEIEKILMKRELHLENTKERKAAEAKFYYLVWNNVYDPFSSKLVWPSEESFGKETDFKYRRRVFIEYVIFSHGLKQEELRYIARSNAWRIRYSTATKTGESLFGIPINEYNVDQLMLLYWSHYYQSINEMLPEDRPSEEIIEDDQALDAYMKDWQAERSRDATASKAKKGKRYGDNSAWDHGETLVMQSNPMHADIDYSETLAEKGKHAKDKVFDAAPVNRSKKKG